MSIMFDGTCVRITLLAPKSLWPTYRRYGGFDDLQKRYSIGCVVLCGVYRLKIRVTYTVHISESAFWNLASTLSACVIELKASNRTRTSFTYPMGKNVQYAQNPRIPPPTHPQYIANDFEFAHIPHTNVYLMLELDSVKSTRRAIHLRFI